MKRDSELIKDISNTYEDLPYASKPFPQTHPDYLRAVCLLFDVQTPTVETATILEIGCSFGGNIIPLAQQYPDATIVGLDLSSKQIAVGQQAIKTMGLSNIQLLEQDITNYAVQAGQFDYIICHGVYSWVPEPVRQAILSVISKGLSENGVAIVSYNTYPGWKIREVYRDAMLYRIAGNDGVDKAIDRVSYGLGMLDFLKEHLAKDNPWGLAIERYYDGIRHANPSYVAHEYLELVNEPCYFNEFMQAAEQQDLAFIAEADFHDHFRSMSNLDRETQQGLQSEAKNDIIRLEQFYDYLSNRTFRQTILSRKDNPQKSSVGKDELKHETLNKLHIQGEFVKEKEKVKDKNIYQWRNKRGSRPFKDLPVTAFIFNALNAAGVQTVAVSDLWQQAQKNNLHADEFYGCVVGLIIHRAVRLRSSALKQNGSMDKPRISDSNRALIQWLQDNPDTISLTTAWHNEIILDSMMNEMSLLLDGKHQRSDLSAHLIDAANNQRITFSDENNAALSDAADIAAIAEKEVDYFLDLLHSNGLLETSDTQVPPPPPPLNLPLTKSPSIPLYKRGRLVVVSLQKGEADGIIQELDSPALQKGEAGCFPFTKEQGRQVLYS